MPLNDVIGARATVVDQGAKGEPPLAPRPGTQAPGAPATARSSEPTQNRLIHFLSLEQRGWLPTCPASRSISNVKGAASSYADSDATRQRDLRPAPSDRSAHTAILVVSDDRVSADPTSARREASEREGRREVRQTLRLRCTQVADGSRPTG